MTTRPDPHYAGYRYPTEIVTTAVGLYFRFPLSLQMVEELLAARGIMVSHEAIRQLARKFGSEIAIQLRRRAPRRGDKWHLVRGRPDHRRPQTLPLAGGRSGWLRARRAGSEPARHQGGQTLGSRKLLKKQGRAPRVPVTDKLKSYPAAKRELGMGGEHHQHKGLNNRAENSYQPTRRHERQRKRFKDPAQVQRFLSIHDPIANLFHVRRDHRSAVDYRKARTPAFRIWAAVAGAKLTA